MVMIYLPTTVGLRILRTPRNPPRVVFQSAVSKTHYLCQRNTTRAIVRGRVAVLVNWVMTRVYDLHFLNRELEQSLLVCQPFFQSLSFATFRSEKFKP